MIDSSIMNLMMELATFSFIVPLVLIIVWKLRTRKSLIPVFVGAGIFFVFAYVLEAIPHTFFLRINSPVSTFLKRDDTLLSEYSLKIMLNVRRQYPMAWDTVALNVLSC